MKFSIIALIVPLVAGAAIQERQVSPECEKWGSLDHPYPFATQWGQYFLCCNYLGPNDLSQGCCDPAGANTGSGAPGCP
ncbi:hypothetical protein CGCF415_v012851 [Colletotrichum fructicola]|uniref:Uncharacterized protein n=4 Tax=Colletotrichum gloeosporioides species complex TaxID=2707338 RepID=L2FUL3_COLFN|nr:uncharacterized protein CGMCC3_g12343 [Colletotrichum fructicola]XP_036498082.1 uncharacterized protein CGCS363_v004163 [Colletotrichum siamense]XP_045259606.1 uncharacterized protein GCG54_00014246 [Colletotrichum gloeosporioides]XP_053033162.1 uncharacterized protein COL26b_010186 [Colletotrichum chrysophilum]KAF0320342.1 hypothetical protein GQ607_012438 [Colletotrichum asianum]KAF4489941.1 hypothetical protein CGGC5_v004523 [Colletotrichum fructicola Nara gc5]KAF4835021.1 hypothetical 